MKIKEIVAKLQDSKNLIHDSILVFRHSSLDSKMKDLDNADAEILASELLTAKNNIEAVLREIKK